MRVSGRDGHRASPPGTWGRELVYVGRSAEKVWWRNLRDGAPVRVGLQGEELAGTARAVAGDSRLRERYLTRFPRAAGSLEADLSPMFVRITDLKPLT